MKRRRPGEKAEIDSSYGEPLSGFQRRRLRLILAVFFLGFGAIAIRLNLVHLFPDDALDLDLSHTREITLTAPRGDIYDRNANVKLATNRTVPSLWFDATAVTDPVAFANSIAPRFGMDPQVILDRANERTESGKPFEFKWVKRWIFEDAEIQALDDVLIEWEDVVHVNNESIRHYPQRGAAAHLLGFVNRNGEASEGLELTFDEHLRSETGVYKARVDTARRMLESRALEYVPAKTGEAVQLTIDVNMQHLLERKIDERMEACNAVEGMGILMNPNTGEIYAMATRPAYDPNYYDAYDDSQRRHRTITDYFEPGSSFKIIAASAAIEEALITQDTLIDCENGGFNPYGHYVRDFHRLGVVPFSKCFEESSNVAIIKVAKMLGPERFDQWMRAFGIGERTSRDFPQGAESPGILRARKDWNGLSMGSLPMGQEVGVTILQLARAFAVIANGGRLVEPYFVERAIGADNTITYQHEAPEFPRVISEKTAAIMRDLCHKVVLHGTGDDAAIDEYSVGGKTGTAQMLSNTGRGYSKDRYTVVFAGFAPVSDPKVVCAIVIREPMIKLHYGGYVCGPVFRDVVRDALIRLNVPADQEVEGKEKVRIVAEAIVEEKVLDGDTMTDRLSDAQISELELAMEDQLESLDGLELTRAVWDVVEGAPLLPDLMGMSKRQAYDTLSKLGIPCDPQGAGWVISQDPEAGTPVAAVRLCALEFSPTRIEKNDDPS